MGEAWAQLARGQMAEEPRSAMVLISFKAWESEWGHLEGTSRAWLAEELLRRIFSPIFHLEGMWTVNLQFTIIKLLVLMDRPFLWNWKDVITVIFLELRTVVPLRDFALNICFVLFFFGCPVAFGVSRPGISFELQFWPMPQLWQCWILNPLCWVRNQTYASEMPPIVPQWELLL